MLAKPWPYPNNIKAGLWQSSNIWCPRYIDDTSIKNTKCCRSTYDSYPKSTEVEYPQVWLQNNKWDYLAVFGGIYFCLSAKKILRSESESLTIMKHPCGKTFHLPPGSVKSVRHARRNRLLDIYLCVCVCATNCLTYYNVCEVALGNPYGLHIAYINFINYFYCCCCCCSSSSYYYN